MKFKKTFLVFIIAFMLVFILNASLSMAINGNDFFHLTPTKFFIRVVVALLITLQVKKTLKI